MRVCDARSLQLTIGSIALVIVSSRPVLFIESIAIEGLIYWDLKPCWLLIGRSGKRLEDPYISYLNQSILVLLKGTLEKYLVEFSAVEIISKPKA